MYKIYLNGEPIPGATYDIRGDVVSTLYKVQEWCAFYDIGMAGWEVDGIRMMFSLVIPDDLYQIVDEIEEELSQEHCIHNQTQPCGLRESGAVCTGCTGFDSARYHESF